MKRTLILLVIIIFSSTWMSVASAVEDVKTVPIPIDPGRIDLSGTWNYKSFDHKVTGMCPNGRPSSGTITIVQKEGKISLVFNTGVVCNPVSMCSYSGTFEGNNVSVSNHGIVDDEGGEVTNAIGMVIASNTSISAEASSRYRHPGGFECHWTHQLTLSRKEK